MSAKDETKQNYARRDLLLQFQTAAQQQWATDKVFEADAPVDGAAQEKFFGNFPYPYMNGLLHLGHAFSLSKLEFASAYQRLCGKAVLFPQGFHCTGMPIKACADKLAYEIDTFGNPPQFPKPKEEDGGAANGVSRSNTDPTKFSGKKSKLAAKTGDESTQWGIMKKSGIPENEIARFRDPLHWLRYFPPLALRDISSMGCGVDWRRSFITTDVNPYYDTFVRWHMNTLHKQGKIVKDKRYAVYSPKDGQPCADHDRASGEGVGPQEYTLIKLEALELKGCLSVLQGQGRVFLMAATLRPETMYGQTNCWVLPDGKYGAFRGLNGEIYVMTQRSARNLSYQEKLPETGKPECLLELTGADLIGTPLRAPLSMHEVVYVLPMLSILTNKGTGVVTSVPSDSPDDFMTLKDLKKKKALREKFGVADEWVLPFEVIPIIDIPGYGDKSAEKVCVDLKIQSANDKDKLAEAKQLVYLKGFTDGVLQVGPYAGRKVSEAKPVIKDEMIRGGLAMVYSEPEKPVVSRSGDECVVALTDQWYIVYGEEEWADATRAALAAMNTHGEEARHQFEATLEWLRQWACSRSFGLGTRIPWDPQFLVESLSDSTIYMAYYCVAHVLQKGDLYGADHSGVKPEHMTHQVWDHLFLEGPLPTDSPIDAQLLAHMKREFNYWYPFDLRVSGRDLIQNHLTFCLYNHTAIWDQSKWPGAFRCNGHLLLNSEKMSKSTGNFKTLQQAVQEYSADAMRMALADAGDGLDDANFEESVANSAILRLTKELAWVEETLAVLDSLRDEEPSSFFDRSFDNQINIAVHATKAAYDAMLFKEALKSGCYDLQNSRDTYRFAVAAAGMNRRLALKYMQISTLLLAPICPHICHHIWTNLLKNASHVITAGWPSVPAPDATLQQAAEYLAKLVPHMRQIIIKQETARPKKGQPPQKMKVVHADLYFSDAFSGWRAEALSFLAPLYQQSGGSFPADAPKRLLEHMKSSGLSGLSDKELKTVVMPFAKFKMEEATKVGPTALQVRLPFPEQQLVSDNLPYLQRSLGLQSLLLHNVADPGIMEAVPGERLASAVPGSPVIILQTVPAPQ